jgi:hypothetical protein
MACESDFVSLAQQQQVGAQQPQGANRFDVPQEKEN